MEQIDEFAMDEADWRTQVPPDSRRRILNKIVDTFKRHLPFSGDAGVQELKRIAIRYEDKTYTSAESQSDYLRKISLKLQAAETNTNILMEEADWRTQLQPDSRQRIVNKIMETLKRSLPFCGEDGEEEVYRIAVNFEEKIYTSSTTQSDYLRKISLKMLTFENRARNTTASSSQCISASNGEFPPDPASLNQTQNKKGKGKMLQVAQVKADWDPKVNEIFIKLCVAEAKVVRSPNIPFRKNGWNNIGMRFFEQTERKYSKIQLKNHWYSLKRDWELWQSLKRGETGLGWNHQKGIIDASDEWWQNKLEKYPKAAKFRERGLLHADELDILFSDVTACDEHVRALHSGESSARLCPNETKDASKDCINSDNPTLGMEIEHEFARTRKRFANEASSSHHQKGKRLGVGTN